MINLLY